MSCSLENLVARANKIIDVEIIARGERIMKIHISI
jgi:hypothetical protein